MGPCLGRRQSRRVDSLAHITSREPRRVTRGHRLLCAVTAAVTCGHEACPSGPGTGAAHAPAPSVPPAAPAQRAGDQLTSDVRAHAHGRWALLPPWAGPGARGTAGRRCRGRDLAGALAARGAAGRRRQAQGRADGGSFWARALDVTAFCTRIRALHNPNNCGLKRNFLWKTRNPLRPHSTFCKWGVSAPEPSTPS